MKQRAPEDAFLATFIGDGAQELRAVFQSGLCGLLNSSKMESKSPDTYKSMSPVQTFGDVGAHVQ